MNLRPAAAYSLVLLALATAAHAQRPTVPLWSGAAPGSEGWTWHEESFPKTPLGLVVTNVVTPTMTVYLPPREKATGTGVIIAPGGAFVALTMELEGAALARRLQQRGVAAFVLKYRTVHKLQDGIPEMDMDTAGRYGIADGIEALKVVRRHAREWGVDPRRIGIIGFSAGAMVASGTLVQSDSAARPDFAALIYGAPFGKMPVAPGHLPPVFLAWAKDDEIARDVEAKFRDALVAAGDRVETHIYATGGHGFGLKHQGTESDRWAEAFYRWLRRGAVKR